jgi:hypothetical protein
MSKALLESSWMSNPPKKGNETASLSMAWNFAQKKFK